MSAPIPEIKKPTYDHINVGDSIIVTQDLKDHLYRYQTAQEEPNINNITERMAKAARVVVALSRAAKESKSNQQAEVNESEQGGAV